MKNGASRSGADINMKASMGQATLIKEILELMFSHNIDLTKPSFFLFWHFLLWPSVVSRPFKVVVETDIFLAPVYHSLTKLF